MSSPLCKQCGIALPPDAAAGLCAPCQSNARPVPAPKLAPDSSHAVDLSFVGAQKNELTDTLKLFGRNFGDYELISQIARGGMGVVYKARHKSLNRIVALKTVRGLADSPEEMLRFKAEAKNAASLEHPNIVPIYEVGEFKETHYFSMKLIEGGSLVEAMTRLLRDRKKSMRLLADVARAVHYAHQHGILHRDLKPGNILLEADDKPMVADFGLAKRIENDENLTQSGAIVGTPAYMSPEQAMAQSAKLTTATDIYSLGAILYELITGRPPFVAETSLSVLMKVQTEEPAAPRLLDPYNDRDLDTICLKCIDKNPKKRYESAAELADELERWLRHEPIRARPASLFDRSAKWVRRRPAAAASIVLALALVAALAGSIWHSEELKRLAQEQLVTERKRRASEAVQQGYAALLASKNTFDQHKPGSDEYENKLIESEDRFRAALNEIPDLKAARDGLQDAALRHFELAQSENNWQAAREKLLLAKSAGLSPAEFETKEFGLQEKEAARSEALGKRVRELMEDAASFPRKTQYELAVNELISLKDPLTVDLLLYYAEHDNPDCRKQALAALTWTGNATSVPGILPYIEKQTPKGALNPERVQEAALCAVCNLAAKDDLETYQAVRKRLGQRLTFVDIPLSTSRVQPYFELFAQRVATHARQLLAAKKDQLILTDEWCELGRRYSDAQLWTDAADCFSKSLQSNPENHPARLGLGVALLNSANPTRALTAFNQLLTAEPKNAEALAARGMSHRQLKNFPAALLDFDSALSLTPEKSELLHLYRCDVRILKEDLDGALEDCNKGLRLNPRLAAFHYYRGYIRLLKLDREQAQSDFDKALLLDSRYLQAWLKRAQVRELKGDIAGAFADYDKALEINPACIEGCYGRGRMRNRLGETEAALADYDITLEKSPLLHEARRQRAALRVELGKLNLALEDIQWLQQNNRKADALATAKQALLLLPADTPDETRKKFQDTLKKLE